MTTQRNARFWVWAAAGGWVKLTLRPGQELEHHSGGPCDEGYSYTREKWTHEGDHVRAKWETNASDCDGRLDQGGASCCPLDQLRARDMHAEEQGRAAYWGDDPTKPEFNGNAGIFAPEWTERRRFQRDHAAEAAGY